jgi:hypothetical protein
MLQATRICIILDINNIETIVDSRGTGKGPLEPNPADSLACSGLRTRRRLERRLLRFKDRNGFWWAKLSSVIILEIVLASKTILHSEDGDESTTSSLSWKDFMQACQALADLPANWPISESVIAIRESLPLRLNSR